MRTIRRTGRRRLKPTLGQTDANRGVTWTTLHPGIRTGRKTDANTEALVPGRNRKVTSCRDPQRLYARRRNE